MSLQSPFRELPSSIPSEELPRPTRVVRFERSEILLHWSLVLPYLALAVSGILLILEKTLGLGWTSRETLIEIHGLAGASLVALPSLVLMATRPDPHLRNLREALRWHWSDVRWLYTSGLRLVFRRLELPPAGRFNAGQKLNLLHVILFVPALVATGTAIWFSGADVLLLRLAHAGMAALSLSLSAGHMYLALIHPSTRPALGAMFHGRVPSEYARSHHPLWRPTAGAIAAPPPPGGRRVALLGLFAATPLLAVGVVASAPRVRDSARDIVRDALEVYAPLSPGPLHPAHANVPELARCGGCHAPYGGVSGDSCLECHEAVASRLKAKTGYHGTLEGDCSGCHRDHGARLITMDDRDFNHDLALFRLEGAHRNLDCGKCHAGDDATRKYLEIPHGECGDCHADPHDPPLRSTCAECHRQDTWNELLATFAHDRDTSFALDTAHRSVECSGCHRRERADGPPRLRGTPGACEECHEDVAATFAGVWPEGARVAPSPHHREVKCADCHRHTPEETIARCSSCHPADYDRLFVDWQARVELELVDVADEARARHWRRQGKHNWEAVVGWLRAGSEGAGGERQGEARPGSARGRP